MMSESDPFGVASKAGVFDPDAPIIRTKAAEQLAMAMQMERETEQQPQHEDQQQQQQQSTAAADTVNNDDHNHDQENRKQESNGESVDDSSSLLTFDMSSSSGPPLKKFVPRPRAKLLKEKKDGGEENEADGEKKPSPAKARPRFVRPPKVAKKEDDDVIVIAAPPPPRSMQQAQDAEPLPTPATVVADPKSVDAAPVAAPTVSASAPTPADAPASAPAPAPATVSVSAPTDPTPIASSSPLESSDPFGTSAKSQAFNEDAPLVRTSAASAMEEQWKRKLDMERDGANDKESSSATRTPPKQKPTTRKPLIKKPPKPAAESKPADDSNDVAASASTSSASSSSSSASAYPAVADAGADDIPPPSRSLPHSPPIKSGSSSSSSSSFSMVDAFPPGAFPSGSSSSSSGGLGAGDGSGIVGGSAVEETFSGPLESRLVHKNWKARVQAYEEMKSELEKIDMEDDSEEAEAKRKETVDKFAPFLKKMCTDVSVPALEAALQAVAVWVDKASYDQGAPAAADDIMPALLKKGFSGRPGTKAAADNVSLLFIECGAGESVVNSLITGTANSVPKISSACAALLVTALRSFGPGVVSFEKLQKCLPKLLANTQAMVRKEAMELATELYRWMGNIFTAQLKSFNLKSAQEKELESLFEKVTDQGKARPTKVVRSAASKAASGAAKKGKGGVAAGGGDAAAAFDPLSLVKPVDVCGKLSKGWVDKVVKEPKWQQRKELLQELQTAAESAPKIELTPAFVDAIGSLKKCLKDSNVVLVGAALQCLLPMVKGTRRAFFPHARQLFPLLLSLLKEKKVTVNAPLVALLDALAELGVVDIHEVIDPLNESLGDKVSKIRIETAQFLQRWLAMPRITDKTLAPVTKQLADALVKVMGDAEVQVRDVGTAAFAELVATVGRRPVDAQMKRLQGSEPKRFNKLEQLIKASNKKAPSTADDDSTNSSQMEEKEKATEPPVTARKSAASSGAASKAKAKRPASSAPAAAADKEKEKEKEKAKEDEKKPTSSSSTLSLKPLGTARGKSSGLGKAGRVERPSTAAAAHHTSSKAESASGAATARVESSADDEHESNAASIRRVDPAAKASRLKKDNAKRLKGGAYREMSSDEVEEMKENMRGVVSSEVHALLFDKNFPKQIQGIDLLEAEIAGNYDAILSISDLALKWCAWRLCDANTSSLIKVLSFTHKLMEAFVANEYKLHDSEAASFIPHLIEKVMGHNTVRFRDEAKVIIHLLRDCYTPKNLLAFILAGYESKNKRVMSECVEETGNLIVKFGTGVCEAKKVLLTIAQAVGASESHVRNAALTSLGNVYATMGDGIWNLLGGRDKNSKIPQKQMTMIEARFKTIKPQVQSHPSEHHDAAPSASASASSHSTGEKVMSAAASRLMAHRSQDDAIRTPRRSRVPARSPTGSPGVSRSAQVSPRNSISGLSALSATSIHAAGLSGRKAARVSAPSGVTVPTSMSSASAPTSASSASIDPSLPTCFHLDLESSFSADTAPVPDPLSQIRTAPSSPGGRVSAVSSGGSGHSTPAVQSAHNSPHGKVAANTEPSMFGRAMANSTLANINKATSSASSATANATSSADSALIDDILHEMSLSSFTQASDDGKMSLMKRLWELVLQHQRALIVRGGDVGDQIVGFLTGQIESSFTQGADGQVQVNHRHCRYALNTLLEIFKVEEIAKGVQRDTLTRLTRLLLLKLMDERLKLHPDPQCRSLTMAVNVLVLKVLENSDRTAIFLTLIAFLQNGTGSGSITDSHNRTFIDLVVRSLMKMTKNLSNPAFRESLHMPTILRAIHTFMLEHSTPASVPGASPTSSSPADELPLKAIKAMLSGLVTAKGEDIRADLPKDLPASSPALIYIEKMIQYNMKQKQGSGSAPTSPSPNAPVQRHDSDNKSSIHRVTPSVDGSSSTSTDPLQQQLSEIVARTIKPASTQSALRELFDFTVQHPDIDIWPAFKQQGDSFRAYVKRNLTRMQTEAANKSGAGSAAATPLPTPTPTTAPSTSSGPASSSTVASALASTAIYRQRLTMLQDRAKLATTAMPATHTTPTEPAAAAPLSSPPASTNDAVPVSVSAPAPSTTTNTSTLSSIDAIRARFKSATTRTSPDENTLHGTSTNESSSTNANATHATASSVLSNLNTNVNKTLPQSNGQTSSTHMSSIDSIKARIAAMNKNMHPTTQ